MPEKTLFSESGVSSLVYERMEAATVQKKFPLLGKEPTVIWRDVLDRSFVTIAHPIAVWPPPMSLGPGIVESTYWALTIKDGYEVPVVLRALQQCLEKDHAGFFSAAVCDHAELVLSKC
jgi:hypothetical protein